MSFRTYGRRNGRPEKVTPNEFPRIYLFGDSLTERGFYAQDTGFGWQLQRYYEDRVEVINEGANDACLSMGGTLVPLQEYEDHIRHYVNTILDDPATQSTRVILISPPPVNVPVPVGEPLLDNPDAANILRIVALQGRGHRTWQSKRTFANKIVEIGKEFEANTDRVAFLDFWSSLTKSVCRIEGVSQDDAFYYLDIDNMLPGSGMPGAKSFEKGYFTDGLHFGERAYEILGRELLDLALAKWPELKRENFPSRVCAHPLS
ncbi:hypothetical protein FQN49_005940 [Arthroderma sp. PD_2]|nr:hypothetical protein FQN49_005940 [Arthroderma sp. PD_2]